MKMKFVVLFLLSSSATAFTPSPALRPVLAHRRASDVLTVSPHSVPQRPQTARVALAPRMGLFGLGWAELGVIGVIALFFFGPEKLAPLAKDFGAPTCIREEEARP